MPRCTVIAEGPRRHRKAAAPRNHAEITITCALSKVGCSQGVIGEKMSAESVIYYLDRHRSPATDPVDETEWLVSAMGEFAAAELRELLYVAQEPEFFEMIRGLFALPDSARLALQRFLAASDPRATRASIDSAGRCVLSREKTEPGRILPKIVY
jgi:hypothetical protein